MEKPTSPEKPTFFDNISTDVTLDCVTLIIVETIGFSKIFTYFVGHIYFKQ